MANYVIHFDLSSFKRDFDDLQSTLDYITKAKRSDWRTFVAGLFNTP
jgi:hypothetical protein